MMNRTMFCSTVRRTVQSGCEFGPAEDGRKGRPDQKQLESTLNLPLIPPPPPVPCRAVGGRETIPSCRNYSARRRTRPEGRACPNCRYTAAVSKGKGVKGRSGMSFVEPETWSLFRLRGFVAMSLSHETARFAKTEQQRSPRIAASSLKVQLITQAGTSRPSPVCKLFGTLYLFIYSLPSTPPLIFPVNPI
ncbi:hypothetical protein J6590_071989 [Homalodisca vitripennis]|nr:hypothetical protein J6590_071989 [Homalodisca vitripennis]